MSPEAQIACVAAIAFFAALTRSTFGFGEALVAMPLLAMVFPKIQTATQLMAINAIFNSILILASGREKTDWRSGWRLMVGMFLGIPLGVFALRLIPESAVKWFLAVMLIGFSGYNLYRPSGWRIERDEWAYPFGFFGGILGGAYNVSGPPLVIFGTLRGWTPAQFRSTLQGVFLPNTIFVLFMHYATGLWSSEVFGYLLWTLPLVLLSVPIGYRLNQMIHPQYFHRFLYGLLILLAGMLIWSTFRVRPVDSEPPAPGPRGAVRRVIPGEVAWHAGRRTGPGPAGRRSPSTTPRA